MNLGTVITGLEALRRRHENELAGIKQALRVLGGKASGGKRVRVLSAAARKKIGDAQRLRWAKAKRKNGNGKKGPVAVSQKAAA